MHQEVPLHFVPAPRMDPFWLASWNLIYKSNQPNSYSTITITRTPFAPAQPSISYIQQTHIIRFSTQACLSHTGWGDLKPKCTCDMFRFGCIPSSPIAPGQAHRAPPTFTLQDGKPKNLQRQTTVSNLVYCDSFTVLASYVCLVDMEPCGLSSFVSSSQHPASSSDGGASEACEERTKCQGLLWKGVGGSECDSKNQSASVNQHLANNFFTCGLMWLDELLA